MFNPVEEADESRLEVVNERKVETRLCSTFPYMVSR